VNFRAFPHDPRFSVAVCLERNLNTRIGWARKKEAGLAMHLMTLAQVRDEFRMKRNEHKRLQIANPPERRATQTKTVISAAHLGSIFFFWSMIIGARTKVPLVAFGCRDVPPLVTDMVTGILPGELSSTDALICFNTFGPSTLCTMQRYSGIWSQK
jgi:hypothetical protein